MCNGSNEARFMREARKDDEVVLRRNVPGRFGPVVGFTSATDPNTLVCVFDGAKVDLKMVSPTSSLIRSHYKLWGLDLDALVGKTVRASFYQGRADSLNIGGVTVSLIHLPAGTTAVINPSPKIEEKIDLSPAALKSVELEEKPEARPSRVEGDLVDGDD